MQNRADDLPRRRRLPAVFAGLGFLAILAVALVGAAGRLRSVPPEAAPLVAQAGPVDSPSATPGPATPARFTSVAVRLQKNQTLNQALFSLALAAAEVKAVVDALRGHFPFRKARPGDQLRLERREDGGLHRFTYRQGAADEWIVERLPDGTLQGAKRPVELTTEVAASRSTIESSLYESLGRAEEDPGLAVLAADVLAWDVDFYQDVRSGDRMRILVEKVYADGKLLRYGEVLAAEYDGAATGLKRLFRYTDASGHTSYFDEEGASARRGFLKSPLKYANITSSFGKRRHPVLGYTRAHEGVDYGAPTGTPIWAVGDGAVRHAGWNGGCGKTVILQPPERARDRLLPPLRDRRLLRQAGLAEADHRLRRHDRPLHRPAPPLRGEARRPVHEPDAAQGAARGAAPARAPSPTSASRSRPCAPSSPDRSR